MTYLRSISSANQKRDLKLNIATGSSLRDYWSINVKWFSPAIIPASKNRTLAHESKEAQNMRELLRTRIYGILSKPA